MNGKCTQMKWTGVCVQTVLKTKYLSVKNTTLWIELNRRLALNKENLSYNQYLELSAV